MTTIFSITDHNESKSEMFMTLNGVANWLLSKNPIDNKLYVAERNEYYDITADNLKSVMDMSERDGLCAAFTIKQDFFIQTIETRFVLSTINVND